MKTCSVCAVPKDHGQFHKKSRSKDGLAPNCKDCESARKKSVEAVKQRQERYKKNRKHIIAINAEHRKKNWDNYRLKHKEYYEKNRAKWLERGWKQKGILNENGEYFTMPDFERHYRLQGGLCKICNGTGLNHGKGLVVDHNHDTGEVRGILCAFCNSAISYLQDDPDLLLKAADYLKMAMK